MKFVRRNLLLLIVFLTGAAVLIVEVTATRILAPYYGNTIYTFSSVIGIILGALSLGYYLGGRFADRHPTRRWFFGIIAASGITVLLMQVLVLTLLPAVGFSLSIVAGPLILGAVLFFLPSFLLGTLSPFAIKLRESESPGEGIGSISGKVFFWSTMGSIAGSLSAGFLLIPHLGVNAIMLSVGLGLVLLGVAGLYGAGGGLKPAAVFLVLSLPAAGATGALLTRPAPPGTLVDVDGLYERIRIQDVMIEGRPARVLHQDRASSGMHYLDNGELLDYVRFAALAPLVRDRIDQALVIGGGTYLMPGYLLKLLPQATVDVVEIEPGLFNLAQKYFGLRPDARLRNHVQDGRRFLHDSGTRYDLIYSDVFYALTIPPHFATREFFELARSRLSPDGVFMANFVGDFAPEVPSILLTEIKTMRTVFPNSYFFAMASPHSPDVQSVVAVGINGDRKIDFHNPELRRHPDPYIRNAEAHLVDLDKHNLADQPLLTDNYSPTEFIAFKTHRRELADQ